MTHDSDPSRVLHDARMTRLGSTRILHDSDPSQAYKHHPSHLSCQHGPQVGIRQHPRRLVDEPGPLLPAHSPPRSPVSALASCTPALLLASRRLSRPGLATGTIHRPSRPVGLVHVLRRQSHKIRVGRAARTVDTLLLPVDPSAPSSAAATEFHTGRGGGGSVRVERRGWWCGVKAP